MANSKGERTPGTVPAHPNKNERDEETTKKRNSQEVFG